MNLTDFDKEQLEKAAAAIGPAVQKAAETAGAGIDLMVQYFTRHYADENTALPVLAEMLETTVAERTVVKRYWIGSTIKSVTVKFETVGFQIDRTKAGTITVRKQDISRNVTFKNTDVTMAEALAGIQEQIKLAAAKNNQMRVALEQFFSTKGQ
jgi:hypothetical protein